MNEKMFEQFWLHVGEKLGLVGGALKDFRPHIKASLMALHVSNAFVVLGPERTEHRWADVLLCGKTGYGILEMELGERKAVGLRSQEFEWEHSCKLTIISWNEIAEIRQELIHKGQTGRNRELKFQVSLRLRNQQTGGNLPARGEPKGEMGVRCVNGKNPQDMDFQDFIGAMIETLDRGSAKALA